MTNSRGRTSRRSPAVISSQRETLAAERQIQSTRTMAALARESKFPNVAAALTNLADRRVTAVKARKNAKQ